LLFANEFIYSSLVYMFMTSAQSMHI